MYQWLMEKLFPPKCILCRRVLEIGETDLCRCCRTETPEAPKGKLKLQFLDSWTSVWYYEGDVRGSLIRFKFHNARSYAEGYGRLLAMKLLREYPEGFDLVTWVPVSAWRKFRRGYDQVELIARVVARELELPLVSALEKTRNNRKQSGIVGYARRRANVLGVYRLRNEADIVQKRILLLDDILTTGATAGECARVLLTGGAEQVHCGVIAATRKHKKPK